MLKINILAIVSFGILISLIGLGFFFFREVISNYMRFLLPVPPIGVAAYVFVFNLYGYFGGHIPEKKWDLAREIIFGTGVAMLVFGFMALLLVFFLEYARRIL